MSISDRVVVMEAGRVTQIDQPYRLYEHPQTRFISSFVGKANLLEGRISGQRRARHGRRGRVRAAGRGAPDAPLGAAVSLSLRPEKIRLVAPGQGQLDGSVRERFFLGSQWLYRVTTPLGELMVVCANDGRAAGGRRRGDGPRLVRRHGAAAAPTPAPGMSAAALRAAPGDSVAGHARAPWLLSAPALVLFACLLLMPLA